MPSAAVAGQPRRRAPSPQDEARDLYKKAMTHYELGEFEPAIDEFKRAYALTSAPGLLFNIAQVYRMKKDPEQAIYFYKSYLRRMPDAPNRVDVEALITENQALVDAEARRRAEASAAAAAPAAAAPATVASAPLTATAPTPPPATHRHWRLELWSGLGAAALGVGALGAGIGLGLRAASDSDQINRANAQGDVPWDGAKQRLYRDGQSSASAATVMYAVGGVLAAGGAVVAYVGWRHRGEDRKLAVAPTLGGATLVMSCAF